MTFVLPDESHYDDVISFYGEFENDGSTCIGYANFHNYDEWVKEKQNRHTGENLPDGFVRENFYLCYYEDKLVGVFSLKFELTDYLYNYGGHIGYAVRPSMRKRGLGTAILKQGLEISKKFGFKKILAVCDDDNTASEKIIVKNGGVFENKLFDEEENVFVKRYWIKLD